MNVMSAFFTIGKRIFPLVSAIHQAGGKAYLVGGSVRDLVLDRLVKDIDIEVHCLTADELEAILKKFGVVALIGKQFGVFRLHGLDVDWSLPRKDSQGRKPTVEIDPHMGLEQAARRRDVTMNAMAIDLDLISKNQDELIASPEKIFNYIIDPYGGLKDIEAKTLRAVDEQLFLEDPLRFFRVMQFISRFEMNPDEQLNKICKSMELNDLVTGTALAKERVYEEIKKLMFKSRRPSLGFRWLQNIRCLEKIFPELYALVGIRQRPDYHPEGDVFEHTMQALDAAAALDCYNDGDEREKLVITIAALCHDLGKATTTDADLHCKGHDVAGVEIAKSLLNRFSHDRGLTDVIVKLVEYHMRPFVFIRGNAGAHAYKNLAYLLSPEVTMRQLGMLNLADARGRNQHRHEPLTTHTDEFKAFLENAERAEVLNNAEPPVLLGRHLMGDVKPGPAMGALLKKAYEIQISEGIKDPDILKDRVMKK